MTMKSTIFSSLLLSLLCFVILLPLSSYPDRPYFDEEIYVQDGRVFASGSGKPSNVEHPPLGKLIIGQFIKLCGDNHYGWRLFSIVSTSLLVVLINIFSFLLFENPLLSLLLSLLFLTDPMTLVTGKIGMLDIPMSLFYLLSASLFILSHTRREEWYLLILSSISAGVALSIKWTGLTFFIALILFYLITIKDPKRIRINPLKISIFTFVPLFIYLLTYLISGYSLLEALRLQWDMISYHTYYFFPTPHWESKWFEWLIFKEPVWFYFKEDEGSLRVIAAISSPPLYMSGSVCTIIAGIRGLKRREPLALLLFLFPFSQFLLWAIALRITFIYYMTSILPFYILSIGFCLDLLYARGIKRTVNLFLSFLLVISIVWTMMTFPIISGSKLSSGMERFYFGRPMKWFVTHSEIEPEKVKREMMER